MEWILSIPMPVRLAVLAILGTAIGGQLNRCIYGLAWNVRPVSPWSPSPAGTPHGWRERVPVWGWWARRAEAPQHGRGFWIRPLLIELALGVSLATLYWLEVGQQVLRLPAALPPPVPWGLHVQFLGHATLVCLMVVATFIDFDEQTIPDEITVTGAVAGLLLAALLPGSLLPTAWQAPSGDVTACHLVCTSSTVAPTWSDGLGGPSSWPPSFDSATGCGLAVAGIWAWCLAITHRTWTLRHGWYMAVGYLVASIVRRRTWLWPTMLGIGLTALTLVVWSSGGPPWQALLSAVAGLTFGGALIWAVRIIAGQALQVEAMGFGDVTLMAMIGAFLGWQPALLVFFLAPFSALVIALAQWLTTGQRRIAFGPYLCLSAVIILVGWRSVWYGWALPMFSLGWFLPAVVACCLVIMGGLLWIWRLLREALFG